MDDFIKPFEFSVEDLSAKFESDREAWRQEMQASAQLQEERLKEMRDEYEKFSLKMSQLLASALIS